MFLYLLALLVFIFIWIVQRINCYWKWKGVPGPKPWPIIGNIGDTLMGRKTFGDDIFEIYKKYENYPFVGLYRFITPCLLVRDPEFVHRILVTDFNSFRHNEMVIDKKVDPLFGRNPFVLRDNEWKTTRQTLSPGFSSGRMKHLHPIFLDNARQLVNFIANHPSPDVDSKMICKRYALSNVGKAAFGIDAECFKSYEESSEFMQAANKFLEPGNTRSYVIAFSAMFPQLLKLFNIKVVTPDVEHKLIEIINHVTNHRRTTNDIGNDYLQFLLDVGKKHNFSNVEITGHASTFFIDGYITSSIVMSHAILALALNQKSQEILRKEIRKTEDENDGQITYDALQNMPWLNACFYESIRYLPPMDVLPKICSEKYEYTSSTPGFKEISVKLDPGDTILIPYSFFGKDPKYFSEPEQYKPERMMEKENTKMYFFPFLDGPRGCIGQRLGTLQIKVALCEIIKNFEVTPSPKLQQPIKYLPHNFLNEVKGGIWLKYKKIT